MMMELIVVNSVGERNVLGGGKGTMAIVYAARHGKAGCVKKLIEAGADVNNTSTVTMKEKETHL